jgi:hypothetical protein
MTESMPDGPATADPAPRRRRRIRFAVAGVLVVLLLTQAEPAAKLLWAKFDLDRVTADAASVGAKDTTGDPSFAADRQITADGASFCSGLGFNGDASDFHRGGSMTVSTTCYVETPLWSWFGVDHVDLTAKATRPVHIDPTYASGRY